VSGRNRLSVFIFMGPVIVLGAYYIATLRLAWQPLVASLPIAFLVAAILHANNLRDIETDMANGKLTVASLLGRRGARMEMVLLYAGAYAATATATVAGALPWPVFITTVTAIPAWNNLRIAFKETAPAELDSVVLGSAKLHLAFGLFLVAAILLNVSMTRGQAR
jgi:1,4-dihydroxy-2-naphthoate octaprenyltransferase